MHDILGIGNAICDIIVQVEDDILNKFSLVKGSMSLCSELDSSNLLKYLTEHNYQLTICSGGSVANTINYLSKYGLDSAFLGNVAQGTYGQKFYQDLQDANITFYNSNYNITNTAKSIILVTPDGERTMYTSLGCAAELGLHNLDLHKICASKYIYIEGYLWDQPNTIKTIQNIIDTAKSKYKSKIVFSLSDSFCVQRHHKLFQELVFNHVDILFANEDEIKTLFGFEKFIGKQEYIKNKLTEICPNLIVTTQNDQGCTVINPDSILHVNTVKQKPLDTTGAGDSFAAGFLYGLLEGLDFTSTAKIANFIASQVVGYLGARPDVVLPKNNQELELHIA